MFNKIKQNNVIFFFGSVIFSILIIREVLIIFNPPNKDPIVLEMQFAKSIKCFRYETDRSLDSYVQVYTIKEGDSLSLIAKKELGNIQLVDEIISLNEEAYPGITKYTNKLIEPGWKLKLPIKKLVGKFKNKLAYVAGLILNVSKTEINYTTSSSGSTISTLNLDGTQNFPGKQFLERGACVYLLYEDKPWPNSKNILEVKKQ